ALVSVPLERVGGQIRDSIIVLVETVSFLFTSFVFTQERVGCQIRDSTTILVENSLFLACTGLCPSREGWWPDPRQYYRFGRKQFVSCLRCLLSLKRKLVVKSETVLPFW